MNHKKTHKLNRKKPLIALAILGMIGLFISCSTDEEELVPDNEAINFENSDKNSLEIATKNTATFIPDPNKLYFITHTTSERRVGANGNTSAFANTYNLYNSFDDELRWKITPSPTPGYYFIDCMGGESIPRLRGDGTSFPDMDPTTSTGTSARWSFAATGNNTFILTTLGNTLNRLTIGSYGYLRMTTDDVATVAQQFTITEVSTNRPPITQIDGTNHFMNQTITYRVLDNDFDPDGDELSVINVFGGSPNIVEVIGNEIRVTRKSPFQRSIYYTASDGKGGTSQNTIFMRSISTGNF